MVYRPVDIKGRQFVDGGIRSTTNVDIAVERGAKFIVVVNPLVPYVNDFQKRIPTIFGSRVRRVSDMGYPQVGYQAFKLLAHTRLHEHVARWSERYPGRRHHPDRARPQRRADVRDQHHELLVARRDRAARLRVGDAQAGARTTSATRRSARSTASRSRRQRVTKIVRQAEEQRENDTRLAAHPRADDRRAAAPVGQLRSAELSLRAAHGSGRTASARPQGVHRVKLRRRTSRRRCCA